MRKFLLLILLATASLVARSAAYNLMTLHQADGTTTDIALSEDLNLSFTDTHLVVKGDNVEVQIERSNLLRISHSDTSGVDEVGQDVAFAFDGNSLFFNGLPAGSTVNVFSVAGQLVMTTPADGEAVISCDDLTPGAYIVNVNNLSYKILVK